MQEYIVLVSDEAILDVKAISAYISNVLLEPAYAIRKAKLIRDEIVSLSYFPLRNKLTEWEPWKSMGVRQKTIDKYIILYLVNKQNKQINVLRVFCSSRNLTTV